MPSAPLPSNGATVSSYISVYIPATHSFDIKVNRKSVISIWKANTHTDVNKM